MPIRSRPLLIFDGDCHFCRRWVLRWREEAGERIEIAPFQEAASRFPEIPEGDFRKSVVLLETDGSVYRGAEAVFRALAHAPGGGWRLALYRRLPGFAGASEAVYRMVARHRAGFSRITRWLWGAHLERPTYFLSRRIFLRLLGGVYFIAFVSLGVQLPGLIGRSGILPSGRFLAAVSASLGPGRYRLLPTLCWLNPSDGFVTFLWTTGAALSLLLVAGVAQGPILALLWGLYLSLSCVCRDFLAFQWDILLLETGFLAVFLAPWRLFSCLARDAPPSPVVVGLMRWLLFRLMFASGMVKLSSGDPTWRSLTALEFHYETQPLPTWIGWYAHQLPALFQKLSAVLVFGVELLVPFLVFLPRRPRMAAAGGISGLMLLIALTGNYGYFNLLAVTLCVLLLDDAFLLRFFPRGTRARLEAPRTPGPGRHVRRVAVAALAVVVIPLSCMSLSRCLRRPLPWPGPMRRAEAYLSPFRLVSSYGLFARMTTVRNEIIVEGSNDGTTWLPYEFKWKPGDPDRAPAFVEPHMPRLDWQMWFAALSSYRSHPWFRNFLVRLLQGSPEVLALMAKNPFPEAPPRLVRARLYEYHFTGFSLRRKTGAWWRREERGVYFPAASLR